MIDLTICDAAARYYKDVVGFEGISLDDLHRKGVLCIIQLRNECITGYASTNGRRSLVELKTPRVYMSRQGFVEEANNLRLKGGYLRRADIKDILRILRKDEEPLD